jgi:glycosyltransferase involved in cell wall biosynthesis
MRIAIWSNAPWALTGYGGQVRGLLPYLQQDGHYPAVIANYGLGGAVLDWCGVPVYPMREKRQNADVLGPYVQHFRADVVLSLYDIWALPQDSRQRMGVPWIAWTPVDGEPVSAPMVSLLNTAEYPVAYSRFGQREIEKATGRPCDFVPHGIDTEVFSPGDKQEARERLGFPQDAYIVSVIAANKGFPARKAWAELLGAFKVFADGYNDALIYCHTTQEPFGSGNEGIFFERLIQHLGISASRIAFPNQGKLAIGIPDEDVAEVYRASDVMLLPSMGEGFGLPVIEAQACGCPVIVQACSAVTELVSNGVAIEPMQPYYLPQVNYDWQMPSIERIIDALEDAYTQDWDSQAGVNFVRENYSWPVVWEKYWKPFLNKVEETLW